MDPPVNTITWKGFLSEATKGIVDHTMVNYDDTVAYHLGLSNDYEVRIQPLF